MSRTSAGEARVTRRVKAVRLRPRSAVAIALASFLGIVAFTWPFVVEPGRLRQRADGAADVRRAARRSSWPWCSRRSPRAGSTPRPWRCSACCRRSAPRSGRSAPAPPGSRPSSSCSSSPDGCSAPASGSSWAARPCSPPPHHRGGRSVAALPDVRGGLGGADRRAAAPGCAAGPRSSCSPATGRSPATSSASCSTCRSGPSPSTRAARSPTSRAPTSPNSGIATSLFDAATSLGWDTGRAVTTAVVHPARRTGGPRRVPARCPQGGLRGTGQLRAGTGRGPYSR